MSSKIATITITLLMVLLPWSSLVSDELNDNSQNNNLVTQKSWGVGGSNDTGWLELVAEGADPINNTLANGDLFIDFAPGAIIDNLTFEVSVNGSDGYWVNQPQLTLVNTQTEILDWSGSGDLGRQNTFSNNPPNVNQGILDAPLDPNSLTDAYWNLPTGITIDNLIIEALRPVDPKVSFSPIEITIHDTAVNPVDGSLFMLVNEDLIRLDNNSIKNIIDIESEIYGRTLVIDYKNKQLIIGTSDGNVYARDLITYSSMTSFPNDTNISNSNPIVTSFIDAYDILWTSSECNLNYLEPGKGSFWVSQPLCKDNETSITPTDMIVENDTILISTIDDGIVVVNYTFGSGGLIFTDAGEFPKINSDNFLSSNSITDMELINDILYIANNNAGIDRYNLASSSWIPPWTSNNWLTSNQINALSSAPGWLYISAGNDIQVYDTNSMIYSSTISFTDMGLQSGGHSLNVWNSNNLQRDPTSNTLLVGDSSGKLVTITDEVITGEIIIATSPESVEDATVTVLIDDGERGEIWIAGTTLIDRFDKKEKLWKETIDIQELRNSYEDSELPININQITSIIQDSNGRIWIGTDTGLFELDLGGNLLTTGSTSSSADYVINSNYITSIAHDSNTNSLVVGHLQDGVSIINTSSNTVLALFNSADGLDSDSIREVVTRYGVAYFATPDAGVMRIDLNGPTIIGSWQSLGADNLEATPIAVDGEIIYLGLPGFGLLVIDRITGEISDMWTEEDPNSIPDNDIISLSLDFYGGLLVGSDTNTNNNCWNRGDCGELARWDGNQWELLPTSIPGSNNDPYAFYDITSDADGIYAGTNRGHVCGSGLLQMNLI